MFDSACHSNANSPVEVDQSGSLTACRARDAGALAPQVGGVAAQRGPAGGASQMAAMEANAGKYRLDLYVNIQDVFNHVNYNTFIGNQQSAFFGRATSAGPRRVEVGAFQFVTPQQQFGNLCF